MKYLVSNQQTQHYLNIGSSHSNPWTILHFYFDFRATKTLANMQEGLYQSLLYQVLSALPLTADVLQRYKLDMEHVLVNHLMAKTVDTVIKILRNESLDILLLVDGLDEAQGNVRLLINSLKNIQQRTGIRICLASRPEAIIVSLLEGCPNIRIQDHNSEGIAAHLRSSFKDIELAMLIQASPSEELVKKVLAKAEGVFLYASYCADSLIDAIVRGYTEDEAWLEVKSQHAGLESMYDRIFENVPTICRGEVALVLRLLESAVQPITLNSLFRVWLYIAQHTQTSGRVPASLQPQKFKMRIQGILGGLVDFHYVVRSASDPYRPQIHAYSPIVPTELPHKRSSAIQTIDGVEVGELEEIRLLHETLRSYLRKRKKLIESWLAAKILAIYPSHIWLSMYSEIVTTSHKISNHWTSLHKTIKGGWSEAIADPIYMLNDKTKKTRRLRGALVKRMISEGTHQCEGGLSPELYAHLLLEAGSTLGMAATQATELDHQSFEKYPWLYVHH